MLSQPTDEITALLQAWNEGDEQALERLTPLIYEQLRRSARRHLARAQQDGSLQTAELINELYLRVAELQRVNWQNRAHFFALCARQMRWILTDLYRSRRYQKRGGGAEAVALEESALMAPLPGPDLLALDDALQQLARVDARQCQVVELRFFGGLSVKEVAAVLGVSPETVMRDWKLARAWLLAELRERTPHAS